MIITTTCQNQRNLFPFFVIRATRLLPKTPSVRTIPRKWSFNNHFFLIIYVSEMLSPYQRNARDSPKRLFVLAQCSNFPSSLTYSNDPGTLFKLNMFHNSFLLHRAKMLNTFLDISRFLLQPVFHYFKLEKCKFNNMHL